MKTRIQSPEDAVAFVIELIETGRIFHFDDDPATIVNSQGRVFTDDEADLLYQRVAEVREHFPDPCSLIIRLEEFRDERPT